MIGLGGNDIYHRRQCGDQVIEAVGGGNDGLRELSATRSRRAPRSRRCRPSTQRRTRAINLTGNELARPIYRQCRRQCPRRRRRRRHADRPRRQRHLYRRQCRRPGDRGGRAAATTWSLPACSYTLDAGRRGRDPVDRPTAPAPRAINLTGNEFGQHDLRQCRRQFLDGKGRHRHADRPWAAPTPSRSPPRSAPAMSTRSRLRPWHRQIALDDAHLRAGLGTPGALNANAFVVGTAAARCRRPDHLQQRHRPALLRCRRQGAGAAVLFATLQGTPALSAGDLQVI